MKWDRAGSNRRLTDFQSDALPTELRSRYWIANIEVFFVSSKKKPFNIKKTFVSVRLVAGFVGLLDDLILCIVVYWANFLLA